MKLLKSRFLLPFILIIFFVLTQSVTAITDANDLTPTEMEAWYTMPSDSVWSEEVAVFRNGEFLVLTATDDERELEVGDICHFSYTSGYKLVFWNVGETGGFAYGTALLYKTGLIEPGRNGDTVTSKTYDSDRDKYTVEVTPNTESLTSLVEKIPKQLIATYKFTGGLDGEFTLDGETVLRMVGDPNGTYSPNVVGQIPEIPGEVSLQVQNWEAGFTAVKEEPEAPEEEQIEDSGARPSSLNGQVEWSPTGERGTWKLLQMGTKLPANAHIKTEEDSSCIISFTDMSTFVMKEETHIVLTMPPDKKNKIKIFVGNVWVNVKKMLTTGSMEVEMNQAVTSIKGTTFVLTEEDDKSTIQLIEGELDVTTLSNQETTTLEGGQYIVASASGEIENGTFDAMSEQENWNTFASTELIDENLIDREQASPKQSEVTSTSRAIPYIFIIFIIIVIVILLILILILSIARKKKHSTLTSQVQIPTPVLAPKFCSNCGSPDLVNGRCNTCGKGTCPQCGQDYRPGSAFCSKCGVPLK